MAVDMFLKLGDIKGESLAAGHTEEIEVLSWSWGCSQTGTTHSGTGGGTGTASVQDLTISKYVDKSSPTIVQACCQGMHMPEAVLTLRKAGGNEPVEYLKITLKEVLISSHSVGFERRRSGCRERHAQLRAIQHGVPAAGQHRREEGRRGHRQMEHPEEQRGDEPTASDDTTEPLIASSRTSP